MDIKKIYNDYKPFFKGVLTSLGMIAIYDWVVAPGLTYPNTFINILSFLLGGAMMVVMGILIWENLFKNNKNEKTWQETPSETTGKTSNEDSKNSEKKDNENSNN